MKTKSKTPAITKRSNEHDKWLYLAHGFLMRAKKVENINYHFHWGICYAIESLRIEKKCEVTRMFERVKDYMTKNPHLRWGGVYLFPHDKEGTMKRVRLCRYFARKCIRRK